MNNENRFATLIHVCSLLLIVALCSALPQSSWAQATEAPEKSAESKKPAETEEKQEPNSDQQPESSADSDGDGAQKQDDQPEADQNKEKPEPSDDQEDDSADEDNDDRRGGFLAPWSRRSTKSSKRDAKFVSLFEPVSASMEAATVRILSDDEQVALGTVIEADGLILTKASELRQQMVCQIGDLKLVPKIIGIHPETDLALLKVNAPQPLNVVQWTDKPTPALGRWVVSPKAEKDDPAIGIISTDGAREIPPSRPFIGINMLPAEDGGVRITRIVNKSPAELAGLQVGDRIYEIDGHAIENNNIVDAIGQYDVGDRITLSVERFGDEIKLKLTLAERDKISPESQRSNQQNSMGSKLSRRRKDFPKAFQHDSMLNADTCGGPIVDLTGKAIGINIARDGRVSSLALPVETIRPVIEKLKTGELAPEVVNAEKIAAIEAELNDIEEKIGQLPEKKIVLNNRFNAERAREEEIERMIEDLQKRKSEIEKRADELKDELDDVRRTLRSSEKVRDKLQKDLEQLKTGSSR